MKKYLKLLRVHHYIKNGLIILPLLFNVSLFNVELLIKVLVGFIMFSLTSSIVYIINDINDIEKDKLHPIKKNRPIAAGIINIKKAWLVAIILLILSIALGLIMKFSINSYVILFSYLFLNIMYSIKLKEYPIIDIIILVSGFVLRIVYGSAITGISISDLFYFTVMSISFYLGLGKRRNEIVKNNYKTRKVLRFYTKNFLDKNMYVFSTLAIVFYSLWTREMTDYKYIIWTVPLVIIICLRYSLDVETDSHGDPTDVLLSDKILMLLVALYAAIMFLIIYVY